MTQHTKLDPLFDTARQLVLDTRNPSISLVQRHLMLGYNRAKGLIAAMEGDIVSVEGKYGLRRMLNGETATSANVPFWSESTGWVWAEHDIQKEFGTITFNCFSHVGLNTTRNDDALLLDGLVLQGTVNERATLDLSKPRYFAIAKGVPTGSQPRRASRQLLSLLHMQLQLQQTDCSQSIQPLLWSVQQKYAALGADMNLQGMASTLIGVKLAGNQATIFTVGNTQAYLLTKFRSGSHAHLFSHENNFPSNALQDGNTTTEHEELGAKSIQNRSRQFIADTESVELDVNIVTHTFSPGERLLICSRDLREDWSDIEMTELFDRNCDEDIMNIYQVLHKEGRNDNISAIVLDPVI